LEIDIAAISEQAKKAITKQVGEQVNKFNFEILLKEKFPFKPPVVTTRTSFSNPSLADGRDLLDQILPHCGNDSWRPSMNLSELIKQIPSFIHDVVCQQRAENTMIG
jgi:ubiquitin-protein ligase